MTNEKVTNEELTHGLTFTILQIRDLLLKDTEAYKKFTEKMIDTAVKLAVKNAKKAGASERVSHMAGLTMRRKIADHMFLKKYMSKVTPPGVGEGRQGHYC